MKKTILSLILATSLITPTLSHSIPAIVQLLFDASMFAVNARTTPTHWRRIRQGQLPSATFLHLGIYLYTLPKMYSALLKASTRAAINAKT